MAATLMIVDDEDLVRWSLRERLQQGGHQIIEAATAAEAVRRFGEGVDLVLLDFRLPDGDGLSVLRRLREIDPGALVILMTAFSSIESAVEAMKLGAYHYVNKPFNLEEIAHLVDQALETTRLRREVKALRRSQSEPYALDRVIGESAAMRATRALLARIGGSSASTVLLTGESGTGKDQAAKAIHYNGSRAAGPFVNVTCSALPEALIENELFGHEKGAFTDARERKRGLLEMADGGTLFLDEIGELSLPAQAKLLRFLEEKTFKRVSGLNDVRVDVRVVAATNRDLQDGVKRGTFRGDLFHRLMVMPVALPPLRERDGDIPLLVAHFIDRFNGEFRKSVQGVSAAALKRLEAYGWPGNVRELRNAIERAMLLTEGSELDAADFAMIQAAAPAGRFELPAQGVNFEELERDMVVQALTRAHGNQTRAGALLGMNRYQIRYRMEKFGLGALRGGNGAEAKTERP